MPDFTTTLFSNLNIQAILVGLIVIFILQKIRLKLKYKLPPGPFAWPLLGTLEGTYQSEKRFSFSGKCLLFSLSSMRPATRLSGVDGLRSFGKHAKMACIPYIGKRTIATGCTVQAKFTHELFMVYKKKYGPVFQVFFGPLRIVVLNDFKVVNEAMITQKADFANRPQWPSVLMLTEGAKNIGMANYTPTWKLHRKIAGKALKEYMMGNRLESVIHKSMTKCLNLMAKETGPFDPAQYLNLIVFNILDAVVFGESAELDDPEFQLLIKMNKGVNDSLSSEFVEDMFPILLKIRPTERYRYAEECSSGLVKIIRRKFREHEQTFDAENLRDFTDELILARREAEGEENEDLLSQLTETHLVQTISDIFFAGIATSQITLHYALRFMAMFPDIQSKVQEEIFRIIVGKDRYPMLADTKHLKYAEATLQEVMRLGMALPTGFPHVTTRDTTVGGYDIPKDTMCIINHWALHHDPTYWKDVETFDPTRYLDEHGNINTKPASWLPFSMGRRVCLGEKVAKPELHLSFCCLLQRFDFSLAPGTNPEMEHDGSSLILRPANYKVIVKERK